MMFIWEKTKMSRKTFFKHVCSRFCAVSLCLKNLKEIIFFSNNKTKKLRTFILVKNFYFYFKYFQTPENCNTSIRTIFYVFINTSSNVVELIFLILLSVAILHKKILFEKELPTVESVIVSQSFSLFIALRIVCVVMSLF